MKRTGLLMTAAPLAVAKYPEMACKLDARIDICVSCSCALTMSCAAQWQLDEEFLSLAQPLHKIA